MDGGRGEGEGAGGQFIVMTRMKQELFPGQGLKVGAAGAGVSAEAPSCPSQELQVEIGTKTYELCQAQCPGLQVTVALWGC